MIKGLILISVKEPPVFHSEEEENVSNEKDLSARSSRALPKWSTMANYFPEKEDEPKEETLNEILIRYFSSNENPTLNIRLYPYKYYILPVQDDLTKILIFVLDNKESLVIAQIFAEETAENLQMQIKGNSDLKVILEEIFFYRNNITQKLESEQLLQEDIGKSANKLIDSGKFDKAQDLIKLAKVIPEKMVSTYLKSKQAAKEHNYRQTRKLLNDCIGLAQKIKDEGIQCYLAKKIDVYTQIPQYEKDVRVLISSISKELTKNITLPSYQRQVYKLDKALDLMDKLEEDVLIEKTMELSNMLILAGKLVFDLKSLDRKIKTIILELKEQK